MEDPSSSLTPKPALTPTPALTFKRGHHGRYRFALSVGDRHLTGCVMVEVTDAPRHHGDAEALSAIEDLAAQLLAAARSRAKV